MMRGPQNWAEIPLGPRATSPARAPCALALVGGSLAALVPSLGHAAPRPQLSALAP